MQEELIGYYYLKLVQFLVFDFEENKKVREGVYDEILKEQNFLISLEGFIMTMCNNNYLEEMYKDNVRDILIRLGNIDLVKLLYNSKINNIKIKLNSSDDSNALYYYAYETTKRIPNIPIKMISSQEKIRDLFINNISTSISNDYTVLVTLIGSMSDEDFENIFIPAYALRLEFFYSIRAILDEQKDIIFCEKSIERIKIILEYNKKNIKMVNMDSHSKKILKYETEYFKKYV